VAPVDALMEHPARSLIVEYQSRGGAGYSAQPIVVHHVEKRDALPRRRNAPPTRIPSDWADFVPLMYDSVVLRISAIDRPTATDPLDLDDLLLGVHAVDDAIFRTSCGIEAGQSKTQCPPNAFRFSREIAIDELHNRCSHTRGHLREPIHVASSAWRPADLHSLASPAGTRIALGNLLVEPVNELLI
jgi:hypothetical protein